MGPDGGMAGLVRQGGGLGWRARWGRVTGCVGRPDEAGWGRVGWRARWGGGGSWAGGQDGAG